MRCKYLLIACRKRVNEIETELEREEERLICNLNIRFRIKDESRICRGLVG